MLSAWTIPVVLNYSSSSEAKQTMDSQPEKGNPHFIKYVTNTKY